MHESTLGIELDVRGRGRGVGRRDTDTGQADLCPADLVTGGRPWLVCGSHERDGQPRLPGRRIGGHDPSGQSQLPGRAGGHRGQRHLAAGDHGAIELQRPAGVQPGGVAEPAPVLQLDDPITDPFGTTERHPDRGGERVDLPHGGLGGAVGPVQAIDTEVAVIGRLTKVTAICPAGGTVR